MSDLTNASGAVTIDYPHEEVEYARSAATRSAVRLHPRIGATPTTSSTNSQVMAVSFRAQREGTGVAKADVG
jgi:hypothetical protein